MPKFMVSGVVVTSCFTEVEAEDVAEALEIAEKRKVATLVLEPFCEGVNRVWHTDTDGTPQALRVEIHK